MSLENWVELAVFLGLLVAAWLSVQKPPALDYERLWKTILATVIRGEVEAGGGRHEQWWERLLTVPYHPAGRSVYAKLHRPHLKDIAVPALDGERILVDALIEQDGPLARAELMFRTLPAASEALMVDPAELGPAYDPASVLAPGVGWEAVALWEADLQAAIARRFNDVVVAVVGFDERPMIAAVPHCAVVKVTNVDEASLCALLTTKHQRLVILAKGDGLHRLLAVLHANDGLRDRVFVVLNLGEPLMVGAQKEWMDLHFQHDQFDTELNRRTLYMAITDGGEGWSDASGQVFPVPKALPSGWEPIESVDLGPLILSQQDPELFARALWVLLSFCVASR
jgi:hypothetical protein